MGLLEANEQGKSNEKIRFLGQTYTTNSLFKMNDDDTCSSFDAHVFSSILFSIVLLWLFFSGTWTNSIPLFLNFDRNAIARFIYVTRHSSSHRHSKFEQLRIFLLVFTPKKFRIVSNNLACILTRSSVYWLRRYFRLCGISIDFFSYSSKVKFLFKTFYNQQSTLHRIMLKSTSICWIGGFDFYRKRLIPPILVKFHNDSPTGLNIITYNILSKCNTNK